MPKKKRDMMREALIFEGLLNVLLDHGTVGRVKGQLTGEAPSDGHVQDYLAALLRSEPTQDPFSEHRLRFTLDVSLSFSELRQMVRALTLTQKRRHKAWMTDQEVEQAAQLLRDDPF